MDTEKRLISAVVVRNRFGGISRMTLHRWMEAGILPVPIRIKGRMLFVDDERVAVDYVTARHAERKRSVRVAPKSEKAADPGAPRAA